MTQVMHELELLIDAAIDDGIKAVTFLKRPSSVAFIERAAHLIAQTFRLGGKLLLAGNGGSLCDAMHFAEELTGQFRKRRPALPAIVLSEPGHLTCVANDMGYDEVFARGVEAFGKPCDVFVVLTTSGNSPNLIRAVEVAREKDLKVISFLGKSGGKLKGCADLELLVDGFATSDRIQEAHMAASHIIIEVIEKILFDVS
jgi:D-sedoheptulose 7-phosphate isomerase